MSVSAGKRRYLLGTLILVLIFSLGLNLYNSLVIQPKMQATINNMRVEALQDCLGTMGGVKNVVRRAETNFDVKEAVVYASYAIPFMKIFISGIDVFRHPEKLYYWVQRATYDLRDGLNEVYFGNETGVVTERNLDKNILAMIENLSEAIENIERRVDIPPVRGLHILSVKGVDPAQQLREADVLTDVLDYLKQICKVSGDMYNYYR